MSDASRNFTSMTNEEIMGELEKVESLNRERKRLLSQLKLHSYIDGLLLWTKDKKELRGEEAVRYIKRRLVAVIRELAG